jgi:hypothetical protein
MTTDKKISVATPKTSLTYTDMIPVAKSGDSAAYALTGAAIMKASWANVKAYGAVGNGITDDYDAFAAAIAANLTVFVPTGSYKIGSTLNFRKGTHLIGNGYDTYLYAACDPLIYISNSYWDIENLYIRWFTGYQYAYTGVHIDSTPGQSPQSGAMNNVVILQPSYGIKIQGLCYYNQFRSFRVHQFGNKGIAFLAVGGYYPNNNQFYPQAITAKSNTAGTIGIDMYGNANLVEGGEINECEIGVQNTVGFPDKGANEVRNVYFENNNVGSSTDYALHAVSGVTIWSGNHSGYSRIQRETGAVILSGQNGFGPLQSVAPPNLPFYDCSGLYLFKEGTGATVADKSGNARDATIAGGGTWVRGMSKNAVQCDSTAGQYIDIPTSVIDADVKWTAMIAYKPIVYADPTVWKYNTIIELIDGTSWMKACVPRPGMYLNSFITYPGTGSATLIGVNSSYIDTGEWIWLGFCYDPVNNLVLARYPDATGWQTSYPLTNVLAGAITSIHLNGGNTHTHTIQYSFAAFWQRELTYDEILAVANNAPLLGMMA